MLPRMPSGSNGGGDLMALELGMVGGTDNESGAEEMAHELKASAALPEDQGLVPRLGGS